MVHGLFGNLNSMWDIVSDMATNRLWIYTSIGGSILGAVCLAYLSTTRAGLWFYAKIDNGMDFLVERYGWTWLEQPEDAMEARLKELEK